MAGLKCPFQLVRVVDVKWREMNREGLSVWAGGCESERDIVCVCVREEESGKLWFTDREIQSRSVRLREKKRVREQNTFRMQSECVFWELLPFDYNSR